MNDPNLLVPAIVVFLLMLVGLGLTMVEFSSISRNRSARTPKRVDENAASGVPASHSRHGESRQ